MVLGYYLERHYGWEKEVAAAATREEEARHWPLRWMIEIVRKVKVVIFYPLHHQLEGAVDVAKTRRISPRRDSWLTWVVWYCWEANHRSPINLVMMPFDGTLWVLITCGGKIRDLDFGR